MKPPLFTDDDYASNEGMMTKVWGPATWHLLHTMSFNYPVKPSREEKYQYKSFVESLTNVLPCRTCRTNLSTTLKSGLPIRMKEDMKNCQTFSRRIYELHEHVRKQTHTGNNYRPKYTYDQVRSHYECFRARPTAAPRKCTIQFPKIKKTKKIKN